MKLTNRTAWKTADLRAIVAKVAADELSDHPLKRKRLRVDVIHTRMRGGGVSGVAWTNGCRVRLRIPKTNADPVLFAWLAAHEIAHVRGMGHRRMPDYLNNYTATSRERWAWAAAYPIRPAAPLVKSSLTAVQAARDHAVAMLRKADTRLKRAGTIRAKWARKAAAAERRLAFAEGATEDTSFWKGRPVPAADRAAAGSGSPE